MINTLEFVQKVGGDILPLLLLWMEDPRTFLVYSSVHLSDHPGIPASVTEEKEGIMY